MPTQRAVSRAQSKGKISRDDSAARVTGTPGSGSGTFRFSGSEEDLAPVLAGLVAINVQVTSFGEVKQTVEEVYMKLSTHEVM